jgi:hypothetical protein
MLNVSMSVNFGTFVSCDRFTSSFIFLFWDPGLLPLLAPDFFTSSVISEFVLLVEFSLAVLTTFASGLTEVKTEGVNLTFLC